MLMNCSGEYCITESDGGVEDVQRRNSITGHNHGLVARHNEQWEQDREHASSHYLAFRHACDYSEWKTKSKKVWPVSFHQVESLVKFYSLRKPLVFKTVERVQKALMDKIDSSSKDFDGNQGKDLPLEEEDDFNHDTEHGVSYHHRN